MSKTQTILNEISPSLRSAISAVAQDCAYDVIQSYHDCGEEVPDDMSEVFAEVALDAHRLITWGYKDAHEEMERLIDKYGYEDFLKAVATFTDYA